MSTILVVDDMPDIRLLVSKILSSAGYEILQASSGVEALSVLHEHEEVDLVLLDGMMPEMNGFDTIAYIRSSDSQATKCVRVCFLTAKKTEIATKKALRLGADAYLTKPIDKSSLLNAINDLLEEDVMIA